MSEPSFSSGVENAPMPKLVTAEEAVVAEAQLSAIGIKRGNFSSGAERKNPTVDGREIEIDWQFKVQGDLTNSHQVVAFYPKVGLFQVINRETLRAFDYNISSEGIFRVSKNAEGKLIRVPHGIDIEIVGEDAIRYMPAGPVVKEN